MKFSVIIPVAKKDSRFLRRALLSFQDQDLKDFETIVVTDGFKMDLPVEDQRFSIFEVEKSGAAKCRNFGATKATGDYLFFFDADCVLFPGMLQLAYDTLIKQSVDFVYSGYRFNHMSLNVYPSRPFNEYLIESMNYISTMSPMKREVFDVTGGFREDLPFFQDWDFFIRAIKDFHFKGYYIKDYMFSTEIPNPNSISGSKEFTFKEKVAKIGELNNIKHRDICVTTLSAPHQSIERAKCLDARYIGLHESSGLLQTPAGFDIGSEVVILQGFFPEALDAHFSAFPQDCIKIVNWIGTDVWQLRNKFSFESLKVIKNNYLKKIDIHLCNSPLLREELLELGIDATIVYQPITEDIVATKLPKKPTVSAYCSSGHPLHSEYFIKDLAKSMPDIDFVLFGTKLTDTVEENIRFMGFVPIQKAIDLSTMHIRITGHDGFPHTPIHFAMAGRRVICNFPHMYMDTISGVPNEQTWEEMKTNLIKMIRENIEVGVSYDVEECQKYYKELGCPKRYKERMLEIIENFKKERKHA